MFYKRIVRPVLFLLDPETAHHLSIWSLRYLGWVMDYWRTALWAVGLALLVWLTPWWVPTIAVALLIALVALAYASRPGSAWRNRCDARQADQLTDDAANPTEVIEALVDRSVTK